MDEAKTMTVDEALDALELDALDVVAQVRRLRAKHTAALKAAREEGGAEMREACARIADTAAEAAKVRALGIGKRALESMLATARREGAEEMRWEASEAAEQWLIEVEEVTQDSPADLADAIRALPLDAPGGAT